MSSLNHAAENSSGFHNFADGKSSGDELIAEAKADFEKAMRDAGLVPPDAGIVADGRIHRCDVAGGKNGKGDGAYVFDADGVPAGAFWTWQNGAERTTWKHARLGRKLTPAEIAAHREKLRKIQTERDAELARRRALAIIKGATEAPEDHPYLVCKKIAPHGALYSKQPIAISPWRNSKPGVLIIPLRDTDGTLHNVQLIDAEGNKNFLSRGRVAALFCVIGKAGAVFTEAGISPNGLNLICEDFATGVSCFEAMDKPVAVAFDAGNLKPVAEALSARYPKAKFIICGDDDWKSKDPNGNPINPGKTHAEKAARAIGAEVAFPTFAPGRYRDDKQKDFNDLHQSEGLGSVRACIERAETLEKIEAKAKAADEANAWIEAAIEKLAALPEPDYQLVRKAEAKHLGFSVTFLDKLVLKLRKASAAAAAPDPGAAAAKDVEPWPEAVDGGALLAELIKTFKAHMVMPREERLTTSLWVLHTHTHDAAAISPYLAVTSPLPRCGKTTLLSLLRELTRNALPAASITAAAVFRAIEEWHPTLLIDEADRFLARREELQGIINSAHNRRLAYVTRVGKVGNKQVPQQFSTWAPIAIAWKGKEDGKGLPDTIQDRSIAIRLRRKLPSEKVAGFRADRVQYLINLRRKAARWASDNIERLREMDAPTPERLHDRAADNWRTLLNIVDLIGGEWPERAREAALLLERAGQDEKPGTLGTRLLEDIKSVFKDGETKLRAQIIITRLCLIDENPWESYLKTGKQITPNAFAALLKPYGIFSKMDTSGSEKGLMFWHKRDFAEAWERYI